MCVRPLSGLVLGIWGILASAGVVADVTGAYRLVGMVGVRGMGPGQFLAPHGLAVNDEFLFICDTDNHRIVRYDRFLQQHYVFSDLPDAYFEPDRPQGTVLLQNSQILVSDTYNNRLLLYSYEGFFKSTVGSTGFFNLQFNRPTGISQGFDGKVYVADTGNDRIQVLDSRLEYLFDFGQVGATKALLKKPRAALATDDGNLLVADTGNQRVVLFDPFGNWIRDVATATSSATLVEPVGLARLTENQYLLTDPGQHTVILLDIRTGTVLERLTEGLQDPIGIQVYQPTVFVSDAARNQILLFERASP